MSKHLVTVPRKICLFTGRNLGAEPDSDWWVDLPQPGLVRRLWVSGGPVFQHSNQLKDIMCRNYALKCPKEATGAFLYIKFCTYIIPNVSNNSPFHKGEDA